MSAGEALGGHKERREGDVFFVHFFDEFGLSRGSTLELGDIADAMHRLDDAFAQEHEVMRQTKEVRLHGLGRGAAGSGFDFAEFFLELVKNFLDVPADTVR